VVWTEDDRRIRDPDAQLGWEIIGGMVKQRRAQLGWTQRQLADRSGLTQTAISRLENGRLRGIRFNRFARLVAAMAGLDPTLPLVPLIRPGRVADLTGGSGNW
jgi:transcriptional regulator with XRE-family HTH domain